MGFSHLNIPRDAAPDVHQLHTRGLARVDDGFIQVRRVSIQDHDDIIRIDPI